MFIRHNIACLMMMFAPKFLVRQEEGAGEKEEAGGVSIGFCCLYCSYSI